jgi:hypothetical protein
VPDDVLKSFEVELGCAEGALVPVVASVSFKVEPGCCVEGTLVPVVALASFEVEPGCEEGTLVPVPVVALEAFEVDPGCDEGTLVPVVASVSLKLVPG